MTTETKIKIGIYGRTQAGKTRYLFELLRHWETERYVLSQSRSCQDFLRSCCSQIESSGGTTPTSVAVGLSQEDLTVTVHYPTASAPLTFTFRDLRGELLEGEIDNLESLKRDGLISQQVTQCDCFLFFFDPTSWEDPKQLKQHHDRELRRAEMFVEYVLSTRQNKFLPILFLATRLDEWESREDIWQHSEAWLCKVHEKLKQLYHRYLAPHFPAKLIDRDETCLRVTVHRPKILDENVDKIVRLVGECRKFHQRDKKLTQRVGIAASITIFTFLLVGLLLLLLPSATQDDSSTSKADRQQISKLSDDDINRKLEEINDFLTTYRTGSLQISPDDAKALNDYVTWLVLAINTGRASRLEDVRPEMLESLESVASTIARYIATIKTVDEESLSLIETLLSDVGDVTTVSPPLSQLQSRFWELKQLAISERLGSTMAQRDQIGSTPSECLKDLIDILNKEESQVERVNVFGSTSKKDLLELIRTARAFCMDRRTTGKYSAKMRILSAKLATKTASQPEPHAITISSNGAPSLDFSLTPEQINERLITFSPKRTSFNIELGLGRSLVCTISSYNQADRKWTEKERVELSHGTAPFISIGMPLHRPTAMNITKVVRNDAYEIMIEFYDLARVPLLLSNAVENVALGEHE